MGTVLGANVTAAENLARLMGESSQTFVERASMLSNTLNAVMWSGQLADQFRGQWNGDAQRNLAAVATMLEEAGRALAAHAEAQRQVSGGETGGDNTVAAAGAAAGIGGVAALAQNRGGQRPGAGRPAPDPGEGQRYTAADGVRMDDRVQAAVGRMTDSYYLETGQLLHLTDGDRTAAQQARQVYQKLNDGDPVVGFYRNDAAARELKQVYDRMSATPGTTRAQIEAAMTRTIEAQVARGSLISDHLTHNAVDVRSRGTNEDAFVRAAQAEGFRVVDERSGARPHWHLELDNQRR
jgi:hypothetical protein